MFDQQEFKERYNRYQPMLCQIAYKYIPCRHDCEDIVQECFITVWHNGKHKLEEKDFLSYVITSVKNNCVSFLRKQNHLTYSLDDAENTYLSLEMIEEVNPEISPEEKLQRVLSVLPPRCKEIFLMSKYHGLKYKQIADQLNLSVRTVENHIGKALKLVRA